MRQTKTVLIQVGKDKTVTFGSFAPAGPLEADFYFAHPYSSWERGLNENTGRVKIRPKLGPGSNHEPTG